MSENTKEQIEKMGEFFNKRADTYEDHMKETVEFFTEYYKAIASPIKKTESKINILDLGCGTGLEIEGIFEKAPNCKITGIDMSEEMMSKLKEKYNNKLENISLIKDSYLTRPFEKENYDYVVSCMTMHHFVEEVKLELYKKIIQALKPGGKYIEGDYMVSEENEIEYLDRYYHLMNSLTKEQKDLYHIDIPLSIKTQKELLKEAGFRNIEIIWHVEDKIIMVAEV
ncbi:MAG: class I SAM-dependent methyltransferase [Clostridium sp.]|uniref:class I SAM-dependent methyltransferase n=1 Tax=Clostridium sp. TaxID=1506 RepID=UPI003D6D4B03